MIYYRKTLFGRGPKLRAVHSRNTGEGGAQATGWRPYQD